MLHARANKMEIVIYSRVRNQILTRLCACLFQYVTSTRSLSLPLVLSPSLAQRISILSHSTHLHSR